MNTGGKVATGILVPLAIGAAVVGGIYAYNAGTRGKKNTDTPKRHASAVAHDYFNNIAPRREAEQRKADKEIYEKELEFYRKKDRDEAAKLFEDSDDEGGGKRRRKTRSKRHGKSRTHKKRR